MTRRMLAPLAALGASIAVIAGSIHLALRIPGIPYNVRELFLDGATKTSLIFFALAALWVGGGALVVAHVTSRARRPYLAAPLAMLFVCVVSKMVLSRAVTYESIDDIIGSNTWAATAAARPDVWWGRLAAGLGADAVDFIERRVRYTALYSMPVLGIAATLTAIDPIVRARYRGVPAAAATIGVAVVWLWIARTIVITWAGTDNLTELLARHPPLGIGGEWYGFAIALLIGASASLLTRAAERPQLLPVAAFVALAAVPAGWVLLNSGLEPRVEKYGAIFSGAQFLLGPDRRHALAQSALFVRWSIVQLAAVGVTFAGAWIASGLIRAASSTSAVPAAVAASSRPRA